MKKDETLEAPVTTETGEPVTEQAPAVSLPADYLKDGGYLATTEKGAAYIRPAYVSTFAKAIAAALAMKPADFNSLLRGLKTAKKRALPFEARQTALAELLPNALDLVRRKKAPRLLLDFVQLNQNAIHSDEEWYAFFRHVSAIYGYLSMDGGDAIL